LTAFGVEGGNICTPDEGDLVFHLGDFSPEGD
jgi:hypothetical protein